MPKPTDEFLTHDDWDNVERRFNENATDLYADLIEHEPVLAEASATRQGQLSKSIEAQDLTPEVKFMLKAQSIQMMVETMALMRQLQDKVMAGLLPKADASDNSGDGGSTQQPKA